MSYLKSVEEEQEQTGAALCTVAALRDAMEMNLSPSALGVYSYLLLSSGRFSQDRVAKDLSCGRVKISTAMRELEEVGLLERKRIYDPKTKAIKEWEYLVKGKNCE